MPSTKSMLSAGAPPLKVLVLARESVLHWTPLYIEAFRERCDTIVAGPALDRALLERVGRGHTAAFLEPNDIVIESESVREILDALPAGWRPDLVVRIQSVTPPYRDMAWLTCPTAHISVDTWHDPPDIASARPFDFVFVAQPVFLPYFRCGGNRHVHWLPLACAPARHRPVPMEKDFDIVFVGSTLFEVNNERVARLRRLGGSFSVAHQQGVGSDEMCRSFCRGRLAFNSSIAQDVNMRVFEVLAMGMPLLTNRDAEVNGLFDLFEDGKHLITYTDEDLVERARTYLADETARAAIGAAGRGEVLAKHTYGHRVDALLDTVARGVPDLGKADGPLLRDGDALSLHLPHAAASVVDIGMGMDRSKVALRRRGVQQLVGIARDAEAAQHRARSYDAVFEWPAEHGLDAQADVLLWTAPLRFVPQLPHALAYARDRLEEAGTLVLRLSRDEMAHGSLPCNIQTWDDWATPQGLRVIFYRPPSPKETWHVLRMRKCTRTVHEMSREIYERFPGGSRVPRPMGAPEAPATG